MAATLQPIQGKLNLKETLEYCMPYIQGGHTNIVTALLLEDRITCSELLSQLVAALDEDLAKMIMYRMNNDNSPTLKVINNENEPASEPESTSTSTTTTTTAPEPAPELDEETKYFIVYEYNYGKEILAIASNLEEANAKYNEIENIRKEGFWNKTSNYISYVFESNRDREFSSYIETQKFRNGIASSYCSKLRV